MNQGRVWCVVNPTVGLPLLLGSVALTSLAVHTSVMTHVTWMGNYWQGAARNRTSENGNAAVASITPKAEPAFVISVAPVAGIPGRTESSFVVTVAPNPAVATTASGEAEPAVSRTVSIATATPQ